MKNQRIVRAYDSINPSTSDRERMLTAILKEAAPETRGKHNVSIHTAKPAKNSRLGLFGAIAACFVVLAVAGFVLSRVDSAPDVPVQTQPQETVGTDAVYDAVLAKYLTALEEGWTAEKCEQENISRRFSSTDYAKANAGYGFIDLDNNGVDELIIGQVLAYDVYVWDIYTIGEDGVPLMILTDNGDGTNCHLYENDIIGLEFSGKTEGEYGYYTWDNHTGFVIEDAVTYCDDVWRNEVTDEQISLAEARTIMDQYRQISLQLTYLMDVPEYLRDGNESLEQYLIILEKYKTALAEHWTPAKCAEEGISLLVGECIESGAEFGFSILDLDEDGIDELLITNGEYIFDMYTLSGDDPTQVLTGWERNRYQLCDGSIIYNHGSSGAMVSDYNYYFYYDGMLIPEELVGFDASADPSWPWSYQRRQGSRQTISEEQAHEIMDAYLIVSIPFTSISEYKQ